MDLYIGVIFVKLSLQTQVFQMSVSRVTILELIVKWL